VRFGPALDDVGYSAREHNQQSDLDVLAISPTERGAHKVLAVSCKAMQGGFSPNRWLLAADAGKVYNGKPARKHLRELWDPIWAAALHARVKSLTGAEVFTYVLAVTRVGPGGSTDTSAWSAHPTVGANLRGNPCEVLTFARMWSELRAEINEQIEPSHVGRLAQLVKASEKD
jgi:hypothetical protein